MVEMRENSESHRPTFSFEIWQNKEQDNWRGSPEQTSLVVAKTENIYLASTMYKVFY